MVDKTFIAEFLQKNLQKLEKLEIKKSDLKNKIENKITKVLSQVDKPKLQEKEKLLDILKKIKQIKIEYEQKEKNPNKKSQERKRVNKLEIHNLRKITKYKVNNRNGQLSGNFRLKDNEFDEI